MDRLDIPAKREGDELTHTEWNKSVDKINELVAALNGASTVQRKIYIQNNMDGKSVAAQKGQPCILDFTFVSQERYSYDDPYENTGERGLCQISIKNSDNESYTVVKQYYINSNVPTKLDVSEFLTSGANSVMIKAVGEVTGETTPAYTYTVQLTSLSIEAPNFSWWQAFYNGIVIPFQIGGNISKTLYVEITSADGFYSERYIKNLGTSVYTETAYNFTVPHPGQAGVFHLKAYLTNSDGTLRTRAVEYNIICAMSLDISAFIAINNVASVVTNWSENTLFDYAVSDAGAAITSLTFTVKKDGEVVYQSVEDSVPTGTRQAFVYPMEVETDTNDPFDISIEITNENGILTEPLTFSVDNSLGFSATAGTVFYMNPRTRSNSQANKLSIVNEVDASEIDAVWRNVNWGNDGWTADADGNKVLRIMAGASLDIAYQPFAIEAARKGKTVEIDFRPDCVTDFAHPVLKIATASGDKFVGLQIYPNDVVVYSSALKDKDNQSINVYETKRTRMTLVIMPDAYGNQGFNLCIVYINGVKNREFTYENNDYFSQNGDIVIGSDYADIDVYGIRIYDLALTSNGVLRNNINWLPTKEEKNNVQEKNDVQDANGTEIDFEKVKAKYNVFVFGGNIPSLANPNGTNGSLKVFWNEHPEWNASVDSTPISGQGTSSMRYWKWNLRWKLAKTSVVTYTDGSTTTGKWLFVPGMPEVKRVTAKTNFASSMHSHKLGSVNSMDDLAKEIGLVNEAGARITTYQYPFVGFQESVNDEGETVYNFIGLYTMGPDKGDDNTFGYDTDKFPNLLSIEGSDNAPLCTLFRVPWNTAAGRIVYNPDEEALQYNGINSWDYDAGAPDSEEEAAAVQELYERNWQPAYNFVYECSPRLRAFAGTADELNALVNTYRNQPYEYWITGGDVYYYESKEGKFVPSDTGNGTINLYTQLVDKGFGLTTADITGKTAEELNELFVKARIQKFRAQAKNFFNVDDAIFQTNWVEFNAATDNRAKNTYPYIFGNLSDGYRWKWRGDDMDTIWPITNQGESKKGYGVEVGDRYNNGGPVWNGETSNFWNLIDLAFPEEVKAGMRKMMVAMEKLGGLTTGSAFDKIYAFFDKYYFSRAQKYFCQNLYNADAKWKYEAAKLAYIAGEYTNDTDPMTQALGDHYSAEMRWISLRILYMMSKYSYGLFSADGTDTIVVRAAGDTITYALTPAIDMYPAIANGTSIVRGKRTKAGEVCVIEIELSGSGDQQNAIQAASYLQDIGDWHDKNVTGSMIIKGRMLRKIKLGDETAAIIISITGLTLSDCISLQELDLRRINTLGGVLNLAVCYHLKKVYIGGTSIVQLVLPEGGSLEKVEYNSLSQYLMLKNYPLLSTEGVIIEECKTVLTDFFIVNCPLLKPMHILSDIIDAQSYQGVNHTLKRIRAVGFNETYNTSEMLDKLSRLADGSYSGLNNEGVAGEDEYPVLDGMLTIHANAYEDSVEALRNTFRKLTLNVIGEFYVRFRDKVVQDICVSLWGDGIGVTRSELASETRLSNTTFRGNKEITSFDELQYLTGISVIPQATFGDCSSLKSVIIPINVNRLESSVFNNSGLESITIPKNVTSIGDECFKRTKLKSVVFEERTEIFRIYNGIFRECANLISVVLPDTTRYNPDANRESENTFRDCPALTSVHLPESPEITHIPFGTFWGCKSLVDFNISPYITRIGSHAFNGCHLSKIDLSQTNVESLGEATFANNKSPNITFNNKITSMGKACFSYCEFETFEFPEKVTVIAPEVLRSNKLLRHVILPSGVTEIGTWAFAGNAIEDFVCMAPIPPSITDNIFAYGIFPAIYVPDASVTAYKTATNWSAFASKIYPLSEKPNNQVDK